MDPNDDFEELPDNLSDSEDEAQLPQRGLEILNQLRLIAAPILNDPSYRQFLNNLLLELSRPQNVLRQWSPRDLARYIDMGHNEAPSFGREGIEEGVTSLSIIAAFDLARPGFPPDDLARLDFQPEEKPRGNGAPDDPAEDEEQKREGPGFR